MIENGLRIFSVFTLILIAGPAAAHFGMVIPSDSMVTQTDNRTVTVTLSFSHPFGGIGMELDKPKRFAVKAGGRTVDLRNRLTETRVMGKRGWQTDFRVKRPGVFIFFMEPKPYWEPAEDIFIIHFTKTVVTAFGDDEGWDAEIGLKTEIVPLSRPFGLYRGNVFQGIVNVDGKPVPFAPVEVVYYNRDGKAVAPTDGMAAQTVKADPNGVFTYAAPHAGWWGFSALSEADFKIKVDGVDKSVELGAVIWVRFYEWRQRQRIGSFERQQTGFDRH